MAFKDTEDGINEKGWERAMKKLPPAHSKVRKFTIEREPKTKDIKIKLFPNQREALKTSRAINKLKVTRSSGLKEDEIKSQAQELHKKIRSLPFGKEKENAFQKLVVLAKQRLSRGKLNTKA